MAILLTTNDSDIREALLIKRLRSYREAADTLVVGELGLAHAKVRIDVAVINGRVHGYEIKSSVDTLERLPSQIAHYSECLGKLTLVCAPKHTTRALKMLPEWCAVIEAEKGIRGAVGFAPVRRARLNPDVKAEKLAHLLWRPEAAELLGRLGAPAKLQRQPRKFLYQSLAEMLTIPQLTAAIREFMMARKVWRDLPARA